MSHQELKPLLVVFVSGWAGHGKDTFAKILCERFISHGIGCKVLAFADALKEECMNNFGWNGVKDDVGRSLLQSIGEGFRQVDNTYWAARLEEKINFEKEQVIIISDTRHLSEINYFVEKGYFYFTIRVIRRENGKVYNNPNLTPEQKAHVSESELDNYPFSIELMFDTGDMTKMKDTAERLCLRLMGG